MLPMPPSVVGQRRFPIEDFPDDSFDGCLVPRRRVAKTSSATCGPEAERAVKLRRGQAELVMKLVDLYAPGSPYPHLKRAWPKGRKEGVFGGRWFCRHRGIAIYAHDDPLVEKGVTVHETVHYLRFLLGKDRPGRHDSAFLALVEDAYSVTGIPVNIARLIEGEYPAAWRW